MSDQAETAGGGFWADAAGERALDRYRTLVNMVEECIYQLDAEGRFVAVNDTIVELSGYSREELLNEHVSLVLADDDVSRIQHEIYRRLADGRRDESLEFTARTANGDTILCELELHLLVEDNTFRGTIGVVRDITDRKQREQELRQREHELQQKERRYEAMFEDPNILVGLLDPDGTVRDINQTAMEYIDATLNEVTGEPFWETPWWGESDDIQPQIEEWVERAAAGEYVDFEVTLTRPNGEEYVLSGYFRPVTDDDGEVVSIIISDRDITERKQREEELELFRTLLDHSTDSVLVIDPETGRYLDVNDTACERHGYSQEEFLDLAVPDIETEISDQEAWQSFVDELRAESQLIFDGYHQRKDGTTYPVEINVSYVELNQEYVLAISRDVTERREYEQKLEERERRLSTLMDNVPGMVYRCRTERGWPMEFVSDACKELTDYEPEALETGDISWGEDIMVQEDREQVWGTVQESAASGEPFSETYRIETADGEIRWVRDYGRGVFDDEGNLVDIEGIIADVTDRKRLEAELKESERRNRTLVENFPGAVTLFDRNLEYTAGGGQYFEKTDVSVDGRVGHSIHEVYPNDLSEELEPRYRAALDGEVSEFEVEFNDRHLRVQILPIRNATDEIHEGMVVAQDVTARREYQRRLEESEAKFRMVAENLEEIVWMTTPDTDKFLYVNPAYETVFGQDRETLYEDPYAFEELLHPEDRERILKAWNRLPDEPFEEEYRIVRPDGEIRWIHVQATRIHDNDGDVTRIVGFTNDITERVEREHKLERALDLLNKTEEIADVAGWEVDPDTKEPFWSDHLFELLDVDYDHQPSLDEALDVYYTEEDQAIVENAIEEALETGDPFDVEARFPRPSGDVGWLRVKGNPEVENGEVISLRGAVQDVTKRKEREQALQESRNQLQALIDVLPIAVFVAEADGEIVKWNDAAEEIWGGEIAESGSVAEYDEYEGWWADTDERVEPHEWPLARALEGEEVTDPDEIKIKGFDGEYRTVLNHGMPVRDANGEVSRAVVTLVDISERKEYQRKLEESNKRLEQFAYAASHDLREPLRMVSSYLQLIEDRYSDELDENGQEFLEFAVDGADRMREMIEGLLEYSRVESQGDPLESIDLNAVLADVRDDLTVRIEESGAEITAEELPQVKGDGSQLRQVFQNLLDNAIEYSGDEPPRIHISARRDGTEWVVSVRDEGIGIDADNRERIFEVFERLHTIDDHDGVGIGLALCQRIVERHGGDIWVDSEPGEGTTFSFTLPAANP